jgi:hypothetical protein
MKTVPLLDIELASPLTIITGHYGVGKTNFALNLVKHWHDQLSGKNKASQVDNVEKPSDLDDESVSVPEITITLIDLDVVNPYFRSSDSADLLKASKVNLLGPSLARSTLDTPSLAPGIDDAIRRASHSNLVVLDVGGDPDGARALARYSESIKYAGYDMIYLANFNRPEVATAQKAFELMQAIEAQSGLKVTALINNSHLKEYSSVEQLCLTIKPMQLLSELSQLPIKAMTAPEQLAESLQRALEANAGSTTFAVFPMSQIVKTPWE